MRPYLALLRVSVRLALRDKSVIFFNYLFPLVFFFIFAEMTGSGQRGAISYTVTMVLALGILGNGLWGAGLRNVQERETNILRRYKVTPLSPMPILVASILTGFLTFLPAVILVLTLARVFYGMPLPHRGLSFLILISLGVMAFRSIGLILSSVVNSTQEATIGIQLLYMPMLFLSGATFPITMLPHWAQIISQFLPASYLISGFQGIFLRNETLAQNWSSILALLVTMVLATFISSQIFRWEKGDKLRPAAKLWLLAVLAPFLLLGGYQLYSNEHIGKAEVLWRDIQRGDSFLIRGVRIFNGKGDVIESGAVLVRNGIIDQIFSGTAPPNLRGDVVEGAGKTLLPGLIDVHVHLGSPGGVYESLTDYDATKIMEHALAADLYCGVTAVRSAGDWLDQSLSLRRRIGAGNKLGAELFASGPMFTAEGGHGTEYLQYFPEMLRGSARQQMLRIPATADEARQQVRALKNSGVDAIKLILEAGGGSRTFQRMDMNLARAVAEEAHAENLPLSVHTGNAQDVADALALGANSIEHGSFTEELPDALFQRMARDGVAYDPTLSPIEGAGAEVLSRSLVQQVTPEKLLDGTRKALGQGKAMPPVKGFDVAARNLMKAFRAGVILVTGTDSGNPLVFHGPAIHRELQLWVKAGVPAKAALQAATFNAARLLRAEKRIGLIQGGHEASLLLVDGDPLSEIAATERISMVVFKGERIRRAKLLTP